MRTLLPVDERVLLVERTTGGTDGKVSEAEGTVSAGPAPGNGLWEIAGGVAVDGAAADSGSS